LAASYYAIHIAPKLFFNLYKNIYNHLETRLVYLSISIDLIEDILLFENIRHLGDQLIVHRIIFHDFMLFVTDLGAIQTYIRNVQIIFPDNSMGFIKCSARGNDNLDSLFKRLVNREDGPRGD